MSDPAVGPPWGGHATPYEAIGGDAAVHDLVDWFYDRIDATAPTLRAMLARHGSTSRVKLFEFLCGWLGGPPRYIKERGNPRLLMRHFPFAIGDDEVVEWLRCMREPLDEVGVDGGMRPFLDQPFALSAAHLRNR